MISTRKPKIRRFRSWYSSVFWLSRGLAVAGTARSGVTLDGSAFGDGAR